MCDDGIRRPGKIGWFDLTVPDAPKVRDFYASVVGWKPEPVDMGDYSDFNMTLAGDGTPAAGVCHARGTNADLPAQWLIYITVEDLDRSLEACAEGGGGIVTGPKDMGSAGRYAVIRDPAGAVSALFEPAETATRHEHHEHHHHHHGHGHDHAHGHAHAHEHPHGDDR